MFETASFFEYLTSTSINIYAEYFQASRFVKRPLVHPLGVSDPGITCTQVFPSTFSGDPLSSPFLFQGHDYPRTDLKDRASDCHRRIRTKSRFQDDATDTITRKKMDWPTLISKRRNAPTRKVARIIQDRDFL